MRAIFSLIIILSLLSCKSDYSEYNDQDDMTNILSGEFERDINFYSRKNIKSINQLSSDSIESFKANEFHQLITEYDIYLQGLIIKLVDASENPFFSNDSVSDLGKDYLVKNSNYRNKIIKFISDENLEKHVLDKLRDRSPLNRDGEQIDHITYYFKGIRKSGTTAYLQNKRRALLEIENEFLMSLLRK